jgi:phage N-6-adenine-methyltransferase
MNVSNTYPAGCTEAQRLEAFRALTAEEAATLRQEWETPPEFWTAVNRVYEFQIDVCAKGHNSKCEVWFGPGCLVEPSEYDDSLNAPWWSVKGTPPARRAWCNPGFARVLDWHRKAFEETAKHPVALCVVAGIPGASQEWYRFASTYADEIIHLSPRVHYLAPWPIKQSSNNRESVLYVYRRKVVVDRPAVHTLWNWKAEPEGGGE